MQLLALAWYAHRMSTLRKAHYPLIYRPLLQRLRCPLLLCSTLTCLLACFCSAQNGAKYKVVVDGIDNASLAAQFTKQTTSFTLRDEAISSIAELRERAREDVEKLITLAHYYGYYNAKVNYNFTASPQLTLHFHVTLGQKYRLGSVTLLPHDALSKEVLQQIKLPSLRVGAPISTKELIEYEKETLNTLKRHGYAKVELIKNDTVADALNHVINIQLVLQTGPKVYFGPTILIGNSEVSNETISKYIYYKECELYDPRKLEKTEQALEKTGLFTSVLISQDYLSDDRLVTTIHLQEAKYRSIGAGISYTSTWGTGITAEWENKNFRGESETLSFQTELWRRYQTASLSLLQPRKENEDRDLIWLLEYNKLRTLAFDSLSYSFSRIAQKHVTPKIQIDLGWRLEWLNAQTFDSDKTYYLIKLPVQFKLSSANSILDPTSGQTLNVKFTPATQLFGQHFVYAVQTTSLTSYHTTENKFCTLAGKIVFGNILGAAQQTIPPPDRFYGGSENILRGYKAYTVSPLHDKKIPIGGRSLVAGSIETRFRTVGDFGWAFFYDIGNVYETAFPSRQGPFLQSVGGGIRYNTPIGPLRFDVAVPLHRRHNIDPHFQIFFSIGQSF